MNEALPALPPECSSESRGVAVGHSLGRSASVLRQLICAVLGGLLPICAAHPVVVSVPRELQPSSSHCLDHDDVFPSEFSEGYPSCLPNLLSNAR